MIAFLEIIGKVALTGVLLLVSLVLAAMVPDGMGAARPDAYYDGAMLHLLFWGGALAIWYPGASLPSRCSAWLAGTLAGFVLWTAQFPVLAASMSLNERAWYASLWLGLLGTAGSVIVSYQIVRVSRRKRESEYIRSKYRSYQQNPGFAGRQKSNETQSARRQRQTGRGGNRASATQPFKKRTWRDILGFKESEKPTMQDVNSAWRRLAKSAHPDVGGTDAQMTELNAALSEARRELQT